MLWTFALFAALTLLAFEARADRDVTAEERASITAALAAVGCSGGDMEAEDIDVVDDDDFYEVDDATCADGTYDIDLNKGFVITKRKRDD